MSSDEECKLTMGELFDQWSTDEEPDVEAPAALPEQVEFHMFGRYTSGYNVKGDKVMFERTRDDPTIGRMYTSSGDAFMCHCGKRLKARVAREKVIVDNHQFDEHDDANCPKMTFRVAFFELSKNTKMFGNSEEIELFLNAFHSVVEGTNCGYTKVPQKDWVKTTAKLRGRDVEVIVVCEPGNRNKVKMFEAAETSDGVNGKKFSCYQCSSQSKGTVVVQSLFPGLHNVWQPTPDSHADCPAFPIYCLSPETAGKFDRIKYMDILQVIPPEDYVRQDTRLIVKEPTDKLSCRVYTKLKTSADQKRVTYACRNCVTPFCAYFLNVDQPRVLAPRVDCHLKNFQFEVSKLPDRHVEIEKDQSETPFVKKQRTDESASVAVDAAVKQGRHPVAGESCPVPIPDSQRLPANRPAAAAVQSNSELSLVEQMTSTSKNVANPWDSQDTSNESNHPVEIVVRPSSGLRPANRKPTQNDGDNRRPWIDLQKRGLGEQSQGSQNRSVIIVVQPSSGLRQMNQEPTAAANFVDRSLPSNAWLNKCCELLGGGSREDAYRFWSTLASVELTYLRFPERQKVKRFASVYALISELCTGSEGHAHVVRDKVNEFNLALVGEVDRGDKSRMTRREVDASLRDLSKDDQALAISSKMLSCSVVLYNYMLKTCFCVDSSAVDAPIIVAGRDEGGYFVFKE